MDSAWQRGVKAMLLLAALWLAGCATRGSTPLTLEMRALKPSYWKHEPYIIEYQITNREVETIIVDTDFEGVHRFSFRWAAITTCLIKPTHTAAWIMVSVILR